MKSARLSAVLVAATPVLLPGLAHAAPLECTNWQTNHPSWIWCDDFESDSALASNYFEVNRSLGFGVTTTTGFGGSGSLKANFQPGAEEAGNVKLAFGRNPVATQLQPTKDFTDIYWRVYTKTGSNWVGNPMKMTRATIFTSSNWAQASIYHLWVDGIDKLGIGIDPVSGVVGSTVTTTKYNDAANFQWLGKANGTTQIYAPANRERWFCVEAHMKLNTPGQADGIGEFWIDSNLEARRTNINWRGSYTGHGINTIMLENYWNNGPSQTQSRYYDNFVVSTSRIGCFNSTQPNPPTNVTSQ